MDAAEAAGRDLTGARGGAAAGFTLIEVLVAMVIGLLVLGVAMTLMIVTLHVQGTSNTRAVATQQGSALVQRITREIRDAGAATIYASGSAWSGGTPASSCSVAGYAVCGGVLDLQTPVATTPGGSSTTMHVVYDCSSHPYCTRAVGPVSGTLGAAQPLIDQHVTLGSARAGAAFRAAKAADPSYVYLVLDQALAAPFKSTLELQDGIALRNFTTP